MYLVLKFYPFPNQESYIFMLVIAGI